MTGTTIVIVRHGNTFGPGDTPTRVGARTDLALVDSGRLQAKALGEHLALEKRVPGFVYSAALKRTRETAEIVLETMKLQLQVVIEPMFNEIDYGPDENKSEDEVVARIGSQAISDWNSQAVVPEGWLVNPIEIRKNWLSFSERCLRAHVGATVLVVTSNGIARFAPFVTDNFGAFARVHDIKLSTGALGIIEHQDGQWQVTDWNVRPG